MLGIRSFQVQTVRFGEGNMIYFWSKHTLPDAFCSGHGSLHTWSNIFKERFLKYDYDCFSMCYLIRDGSLKHSSHYFWQGFLHGVLEIYLPFVLISLHGIFMGFLKLTFFFMGSLHGVQLKLVPIRYRVMVSKTILEFSPRSLGKWNPIWLAHIFQLGGSINHQLVGAP